jgi:hypothetical protein
MDSCQSRPGHDAIGDAFDFVDSTALFDHVFQALHVDFEALDQETQFD